MQGKLLKTNRKNLIWGIISGLLLAIIFVWGWQLEFKGAVSFGKAATWLITLLAWLGFAALFTFLYSLEINRPAKTFAGKLSPLKFYFLTAIALYVVWAIWALGVYPGFFCYDSTWQWFMYDAGEITEHHPVLHTLMIGWFLRLGLDLTGTFTKGAFLYTLTQIGIIDLCVSYFMTYLYKKHVNRGIMIFSFAWFSLAPTVICNVMAATKDSLFAGFVFAFFVLTLEMLEDKEKFFLKWYRMAAWAVLFVLTAIMRNNALYPMLLLAIVLIFVNRKHLKRYLPTLLVTLLLLVLYKGPFTSAVTVSGVDEEEYYSVPVQQVMWVYFNENENLTEEEKETIEGVFPEGAFTNYNPSIADGPKKYFDLEKYNSDKAYYNKLYLELFRKYPADFFNAFLKNTDGLWYPWATLTVTMDGYVAHCICRSYDPIYDDSIIPPLFNFLSLFENADFVVENNATQWIFAPGTFFILFLFAFLLSLVKHRKEGLLLGFLLVYWLTFLLGPVALVRYVSYLYLMVPMFILIIVNAYRSDKKTPENLPDLK